MWLVGQLWWNVEEFRKLFFYLSCLLRCFSSFPRPCFELDILTHNNISPSLVAPCSSWEHDSIGPQTLIKFWPILVSWDPIRSHYPTRVASAYTGNHIPKQDESNQASQHSQTLTHLAGTFPFHNVRLTHTQGYTEFC